MISALGPSTSESQRRSSAARLHAEASFDERCNAIMDAIKSRLACILGFKTDDVSSDRLVSSYGIDSLMAVEPQNWMRKDCDVVIAVFDIFWGGGGEPWSVGGVRKAQ